MSEQKSETADESTSNSGLNAQENSKVNSELKQNSISTQNPSKPEKPLKPEEKPFNKFIEENLIPELSKALIQKGTKPKSLKLVKGPRPVVEGNCSMVIGEIDSGRRFWLCFNKDELTSTKSIALAEPGSDPFVLECFLIDEKKATLALLISRILQRLNGQKWLGPN